MKVMMQSTTSQTLLLLNRAITLHARRRQVAWRSLSTSKPSKGDKEKRDRKNNSETPGSPSKKSPTSSSAIPSKSSLSKKRRSKTKELPPILIRPGTKQSYTSLPNPPFDRSHSGKARAESSETTTHGLWSVNASPFLDPQDYCRKSAFSEDTPTRNGTLAARRLLEGKERLLETLHQDIVRSSSKKGGRSNNKPRSYALLGHGVPKALLQNHVNMARFLFSHYKYAPEISFRNSTGKLSVETLRIRSSQPDGKNRVEPWLFPKDSGVDHDMQLYLTVMNRISTNLSGVLWRKSNEATTSTPPPAAAVVINERTNNTNNSEQADDHDEDGDDDFVPSSTLSSSSLVAAPTTPSYWNVDLVHGTDNPFEPMLTPIVDWTLPAADDNNNDSLSGSARLGRMSIRLRGLAQSYEFSSSSSQGRSRRRPKPMDVTMIFRATFQNPEPRE